MVSATKRRRARAACFAVGHVMRRKKQYVSLDGERKVSEARQPGRHLSFGTAAAIVMRLCRRYLRLALITIKFRFTYSCRAQAAALGKAAIGSAFGFFDAAQLCVVT